MHHSSCIFLRTGVGRFVCRGLLLGSELGGPSGRLFCFVSFVRARGAHVRSDLGETVRVVTFPFPFLDREVFPFPSALQGPIQLQLALSVLPGSASKKLVMEANSIIKPALAVATSKAKAESWHCSITCELNAWPESRTVAILKFLKC